MQSPGDEYSTSPYAMTILKALFPQLFFFLSVTLCGAGAQVSCPGCVLSKPSLLAGKGRVRKRRPGCCGSPAQQYKPLNHTGF